MVSVLVLIPHLTNVTNQGQLVPDTSAVECVGLVPYVTLCSSEVLVHGTLCG